MSYILVVDDDARVAGSTAELLREMLDAPPDIVYVTSVQEAMAGLARPGLVALLTDYHLGPGPTGAALVRHAMVQHPDARRLVMSGDDSTRARDDAQDAGAHAFLAKPFRPAELMTAIRRGPPSTSAP